MSEKKEVKYYMVRMKGLKPDNDEKFFKNGVIGIGWTGTDFSRIESIEKLEKIVTEKFYKKDGVSSRVKGKGLATVRRFKNMRYGDKVIIPLDGRCICIATVGTEALYDETYKKFPNLRKVSYKKNSADELVFISRNALSEGLQRRLRVPGSVVSDLQEFGSEIENLFKGQTFNVNLTIKEKEIINAFKDNILENIRSGDTGLQAGGIGLEHLVEELLQIDGYNTKILDKRAFPGMADADIIATKSDSIKETKLLVQVKHHSGKSNDHGAKQLSEIRNSDTDGFYSDYELVLVTSAEATEELEKCCKESVIVIKTGPDLAEWIFDSMFKLKPETKSALGISSTLQLLNV